MILGVEWIKYIIIQRKVQIFLMFREFLLSLPDNSAYDSFIIGFSMFVGNSIIEKFMKIHGNRKKNIKL